MSLLKITTGKIHRAQKCVNFGPEGIGKTTFASKFPNPLFIDTEGGTSHLDVARVMCPQKWDDLIALIDEIASANVCKTLVIDTIDWAEQIASAHICEKYRVKSIEQMGYGKGYTYLAEEMERFLAALNKVIDSGKHVVLNAHAKMRKQELPDEQGAFDRWELKLTRNVAPLIKEWADLLLFINYKTFVTVSDDKVTAKAKGGKRVMYASHHPCWDAKNRHGLPDEMPFDYEQIAFIFDEQPKTDKTEVVDIVANLNELMVKAGVSEDDVRSVLAKSKSYDPEKPLGDYAEKLIAKWPKVVEQIQSSTF